MNGASAEKSILVSYKGIAMKNDQTSRFINMKGSAKKDQWIDIEDGTMLANLERFMVWMRAAMTPNFRKLWGYVDKLEQGSYRVTIANNWLVNKFNGEKLFVISQTNIFGGKNVFLAYMYIGFGSLMLLTSICFGVRKMTRSKGILAEKLK